MSILFFHDFSKFENKKPPMINMITSKIIVPVIKALGEHPNKQIYNVDTTMVMIIDMKSNHLLIMISFAHFWGEVESSNKVKIVVEYSLVDWSSESKTGIQKPANQVVELYPLYVSHISPSAVLPWLSSVAHLIPRPASVLELST